jgi:UDP-2,3-diacylglucosamine hydrolase
VHLPTPCWVVADAHLGVAPAALESAMLDCLAAAPERVRSLVVNGDLFEFWFEWRHAIPRAGYRALAALARAHDAGLPIVFIAGNHDCWGGRSLASESGLTYHMGRWQGTIGSWNVVIDHGDGLRGTEDRRYRALRGVLRNPLAMKLFRLLPPDLAIPIARASSHTSRNTRPRDGGEGLRKVARELLSSDPTIDLAVFGHSHVPALERADSGGIYANAGAWLDSPTFLSITDTQVALRKWDGSAKGDCLDALDRRAEKPATEPEKLSRGV